MNKNEKKIRITNLGKTNTIPGISKNDYIGESLLILCKKYRKRTFQEYIRKRKYDKIFKNSFICTNTHFNSNAIMVFKIHTASGYLSLNIVFLCNIKADNINNIMHRVGNLYFY